MKLLKAWRLYFISNWIFLKDVEFELPEIA